MRHLLRENHLLLPELANFLCLPCLQRMGSVVKRRYLGANALDLVFRHDDVGYHKKGVYSLQGKERDEDFNRESTPTYALEIKFTQISKKALFCV